MAQSMKEGSQKAAAALVNNRIVLEKMAYLYRRWQDEKQYEDINEYGDAIKKVLPKKGVTFLRMSKRPFGPVIGFLGFSNPYRLQLKIKGGFCQLRLERL